MSQHSQLRAYHLSLQAQMSVWIAGVLLAVVASLSGCGRDSRDTVVLYTSVDEPVVSPIIAEFERRTGLHVLIKSDTEATKSAGLAATLEAERDHPRADVWWSNEIFHTIRLSHAGVLQASDSPAAADIPRRYKDPQNRWAGTGLRIRVLVAAAEVSPPHSLRDLTDPRFKDRVAIADPAFGTTGGHVAAIYSIWGEAKANEFFRALRANEIKVVGGNSVVADEVGKGTILAGLTDNDDAASATRAGAKLQTIVPDQEGDGTLGIPTTVALVAGCQHASSARKLVDYLLSSEVEQRLVDVQFARASVRKPSDLKLMDVDYEAVAEMMPKVIGEVRKLLRNE